MKRTLCIVGSHPQTRNLIPWDDPDCDILTINEEAGKKDTWVKRSEIVLQMHPRAIWDNPVNRNDPNHGKWLRDQIYSDVYMLEQYPDIPKCKKYPLEEISKKYLSNFNVHIGRRISKENFGTTAAYAMALAIYLGYKKIRVYGIELIIESEYRYQRPSAMFWFGIAIGAGIEVEYNGFMFDGKLYGYQADGEITKDMLQTRYDDISAMIRPKIEAYNQSVLSLGELFSHYVEFGSKTDTAKIEAGIKDCVGKMKEFAQLDGGKQHLGMYLERAKKMIDAGDEARFSHHEFERDSLAIENEKNQAVIAYSVSAGKTDVMWTNAMKETMQSRRRRGMKELDEQVKDYLKQTATVSVLQGAYAEGKRLQDMIRQMM